MLAMATRRREPLASDASIRTQIASLATPLNELVSEAGARGLEATLIYQVGSTTTGVFSCATTAGTAAAMEAAELALAEAAQSSLLASPSDFDVLAHDRPVKAAGGGAEGSPQTHVIGIVDEDSTLSALHDLVTGAGLRPVSMVPATAIGFSACVRGAIESSRRQTDAVCLSLHLGEHGSVLAGATRGRLRFVRQLSPGVESFVDALESGSDQTSLDGGRTQAAELLACVGIPQRDQRLEGFGGITGQTILPLLQSVLQRLGVEIKQSLRFGVESHERERVVMSISGPGARVPRLGEVVAEQCGVSINEAAAVPSHGVHGETSVYLIGCLPSIGLMPMEQVERMGFGRIRHALWVGAAATSLLIGFDAWSSSLDLKLEQSNLLSLKARLEAAKPAAELFTKLTATQSALAHARLARDARFKSNPDAVGVLAMLSVHTPEAVKLSHVQILSDGESPSVRIAGRAMTVAGVDPDAALRSFVESLSGVPLVQTCRMGATRRGADEQGGMIQTFDLTLSLVNLPSSFAIGGIASSGAEEER